jgi:hypothetical protein
MASKNEELRREIDAAIERAKKGQRRKLHQPEREKSAWDVPSRAERQTGRGSER